MIRSQARYSDVPEVKAALRTTMTRVETLGSVHQKLYQSQDVQVFDVSGFAAELCGDIVDAIGRPEIEVELDLQPLTVPSSTASSLSLLLNELVTNALKHAFPAEGQAGRIRVATSQIGDTAHLVVEDNGVGMAGLQLKSTRTFGHRLIESLVKQIRGTIEVTDAQPGTRASVAFVNTTGVASQ